MAGTLEQEAIGPIEQCFEEDMESKQNIARLLFFYNKYRTFSMFFNVDTQFF